MPFAGGLNEAGLNEAVTPEGNPDIDKETLEPKPPKDPTVMVVVLPPPADSTKPGTCADILKSLTWTK
jgi:hypothetical protein